MGPVTWGKWFNKLLERKGVKRGRGGDRKSMAAAAVDAISEAPARQGVPLVRCAIKAKMFNEKEVKTGLRDVVLAFDGNPPLEKVPKDRSTLRTTAHSGVRMGDLEAVNLPSREWITLDLGAIIDAKEGQLLATSKRAWLRGCYPDGRLFSERVPSQEAAQ
jgi:hypothetical protein